jgi:hypothetical protein
VKRFNTLMFAGLVLIEAVTAGLLLAALWRR